MTTLLDRYLNAVRADLPKDVAHDDVTAEIADELQSQMEERESALGRPLTLDEEAELLKAYGHPRVVAGRYARTQYLIGPELFPFYVTTLLNVLYAGIGIVLLGGGIAAILLHDGSIFFDTIGIAWNTAWWMVAVVTIIFVVAERIPNREPGRAGPFFAGRWDPRELPVPSPVQPVKRYSALIEFAVNFIALLVLLDAWGPHHIPLVTLVANLLASNHASLTAAWYPAYIATLLGTALLAGSAITVFVRPAFSMLHEVFHGLASLITAIGIAVTLAIGPWVVAPESGWNTAALCCLIGALIVMAVQIASSVRSLLRRTPSPGSLKAGY